MSLLKVAGTEASSGTLYVDDVFSTWLYTGNGSTQTITNGIDLAGKGGMVWAKKRNSATDGNHILFDTARGQPWLSTNTTSAQLGSSGYINYNSNGFGWTFGSASWNSNGDTFASWTFRKQPKFFDVVTYTGTGSARTIAHSLGVAPGMIIVKRTDTTGNWQVYSNGLTSAAYSIQLNLTNAQASAPTVWNSTAPTSSVFSVGTNIDVNASGGTYVAYLYAHDTSSTGIIQCGSFTTDGSGNATVNLGWEPQYLLTFSRAGGDWQIRDIMRGFTSSAVNRLFPNLINAEDLLTGSFTSTPTATGFSGYFGASQTFIYMAIRRPNKPPTTGTQVFSPALYTGNDSSSNPNAGFPVDFALIKSRNFSYRPFAFDRLRGANTGLVTSSLESESTVYSNYLNSNAIFFDSNTNVKIGGPAEINGSPYNFVIENFKRAPGFFDVVCYTGTGSATTQAHNLTVVPELMIVKERSAVNNWWVYDAIDGNTKYSVLNSTAIPVTSATAWNNTTPTASVFSIGTATNVNESAQTFVAYLFATLAGISKVGSYTGNGTGQAIACGFSAGARFVLIKRTDSTGDWYTFDSARGLTVGSSPYLLLNSTAAEVTGNNGVYASTGGFTLGSTASTTTNINAATYIFLAVA